jgi:hypothetical protein
MEADWPDYDSLVREASGYMDACHRNLEQTFGLGHHDRFDANLYEGTITFSSVGRSQVTANCRLAGSLSHISNTWLWAWANMNVPPKIRGLSKRARVAGTQHGYPRLAEAKWPATEEDAWQVTAILVYLTKSEGAYRCPGDQADTYLVLSEVCHVAG